MTEQNTPDWLAEAKKSGMTELEAAGERFCDELQEVHDRFGRLLQEIKQICDELQEVHDRFGRLLQEIKQIFKDARNEIEDDD